MRPASRAVARAVRGGALAITVAAFAPPAGAADFPLPPGDKAVGHIDEYVVRQGDVLADIARQLGVGYTEILAANPRVNPWAPPAGRKLVIPTLYILPDAPRNGIVLNLGERRLYYFPPGGGRVETYPIGIGATGFDTPHSVTRVVAKIADPTWIPPPSIHAEQPGLPAAIGPGPDNPLGAYELRLGWKNYLIHGTNKPDGVGRNVSHGCIHLYPEDIEKLFGEAAIGTPVRVIEQETGAAWVGDALYVEVHPDKDQADQIDVLQPMTPHPPEGLREMVQAAAGDDAQAVDWNAVDRAGMERSGLPVLVARRGAGAPVANAASPNVTAPNITAPNMTATGAPTPLWPGMRAPPPPERAQWPAPVFQMLQPPAAAAPGVPFPPYPPGVQNATAGAVESTPIDDDNDEGPRRPTRRVIRTPSPDDDADRPAPDRPMRW